MPSLIKGMDVCLLPYVSDERGYYRSPLKLYEYLAAGKPVVSTEHPEAQEFAHEIYMASTPEDFLECVSQALEQDAPERQQRLVALAQPHSWDSRIDDMEKVIQDMLRNT
jgi:glycosyltransferase involved in cell wall biosynthesis